MQSKEEPKEELKEVTISVKLKNGEIFEKKKIPPQPLGDLERTVTFYIGDGILRGYPIEDVEYFQFHNLYS